jgi:SAM-dependent methyltransferase
MRGASWRPLIGLVPLWLALGACAAADTSAAEASVKPGINESFLAPDLAVDPFIQRFEAESREIARAAGAIAACCGLTPGTAIADVGAGTGLFEPLFDQAVGPDGKVYAVEISTAFLAHLAARAAAVGWRNVELVASSERSVELPARSVDVVFVCDTYHHFEYPQSTLASIRRALRPGGLLVVVDFERIEGVSSAWLLEHVRAGKETFRAEIEQAGFRFLDEPEVPGLEENYLLRFRR